jgi:hypothetical protein
MPNFKPILPSSGRRQDRLKIKTDLKNRCASVDWFPVALNNKAQWWAGNIMTIRATMIFTRTQTMEFARGINITEIETSGSFYLFSRQTVRINPLLEKANTPRMSACRFLLSLFVGCANNEVTSTCALKAKSIT